MGGGGHERHPTRRFENGYWRPQFAGQKAAWSLSAARVLSGPAGSFIGDLLEALTEASKKGGVQKAESPIAGWRKNKQFRVIHVICKRVLNVVLTS